MTSMASNREQVRAEGGNEHSGRTENDGEHRQTGQDNADDGACAQRRRGLEAGLAVTDIAALARAVVGPCNRTVILQERGVNTMR